MVDEQRALSLEKNHNGMKDQYYITALSRLTGQRVVISREMSKEEAQETMGRYLASYGRQKYTPYSRLKVERRQPIQLKLELD